MGGRSPATVRATVRQADGRYTGAIRPRPTTWYGTVALSRRVPRHGHGHNPQASDHLGELVERRTDSQTRIRLDTEFVVTAAQVLHERMTSDDDAGGAVGLEATHGAKPSLQATVVALDPVVGVLVGWCETNRYATVRPTYRGRSGKAETYLVGTKKSGHVKLYDQHERYPMKAPPGSLRYEVELRDGWLDRYAHISTLAEITPNACEAVMRERWDWAGIGTPLIGLDRLSAPHSLEDAIAGLAVPAPHDTGLPTMRLDLDTGTEVLSHG